MSVEALNEISFSQLMKYDVPPPHGLLFRQKPTCDEFCVSCEANGIVPSRIYLDKLSHGCHSDVYYSTLEDFESDTPPVDANIMFVLESPGSKAFGPSVPYKGVAKRPPVDHYYFGPPVKTWPESIAEIANGYGEQFAFIIRHFNLRNAYFTNVIKCGKTTTQGSSWEPFEIGRKGDLKIARNCYAEVLGKEIEAFKPHVVFSFGKNACEFYQNVTTISVAHWQLNHPAKPGNLHKEIAENISKIERLLIQEKILP